MIRRPPRSTQSRSSAASDVYKRQNIDRKITAEALDMVRDMPGLKDKKSTVVYNPKWHKGVVGIVASRLVENYYRPTIVLTKSNGFITGSARSIPGFDLYEAIENCSDLLCLLYTSPSPRDRTRSRMPSSA